MVLSTNNSHTHLQNTETYAFDTLYRPLRPKGLLIHVGRRIVVVIEVSKRTIQIFFHSMEQLKEFLDRQSTGLLSATRVFFSHIAHPTPQSAHTHYPLRRAPVWKMQNPERACKKVSYFDLKSAPLLKIQKTALKTLTGKDPVSTTQFGAAIPIGSSCCFMSSVLQALKPSKHFRARLKASELKSMPVVQELKKLYAIIEGNRCPKRDLTGAEVDHFRKTCIESGFQVDSEICQEDTSHFCQFLLSQVGFEEFPIKEQISHTFSVPEANIFNPALPIRENMVVLQVAESKVANLQALITDRPSTLVFEKQLVEKDLSEKEILTDDIIQKLQVLQNQEIVPIKETKLFDSTNYPKVLPIYLERNGFDLKTMKPVAYLDKITPDARIYFAIADKPDE
ncbi:MAG: hypothetical protein LLF94_04395, partial [Chlamydiales bacterium]|nr:hypothetical protein [Chlamydiales bacterium]